VERCRERARGAGEIQFVQLVHNGREAQGGVLYCKVERRVGDEVVKTTEFYYVERDGSVVMEKRETDRRRWPKDIGGGIETAQSITAWEVKKIVRVVEQVRGLNVDMTLRIETNDPELYRRLREELLGGKHGSRAERGA